MEQDTDASLPVELYNSTITSIYKANLAIKSADTAIDITRMTNNFSMHNVLEVGIGVAQLAALYAGNRTTLVASTVVGSLYEVNNSNYSDTLYSIVKGVGLVTAIDSIFKVAPTLYIGIKGFFTLCGTYSMLKNGYELYDE